MNNFAKMTPEEREAAQRKRKEQADYFKSRVFVKVGCRAPCCPLMRAHQHS